MKWFYNDTSFVTKFFTAVYDKTAVPALEAIIHFLQDKIPFIPDTIIELQIGLLDLFFNSFTHNAVIMLLMIFIFKTLPAVITWRNIEHNKRTIQRWRAKQNSSNP